MAQASPGFSEAFRVYAEKRQIITLLLGFSSGLPLALTGATLQARLTESGVDLSTIGFFTLVGVSYSLKFLWAPMIDRSPSPFGFSRLGRRRGWIFFFQSALLIAISLMGFVAPAKSPVLTAAAAVVVAFLSASQDIVIDAYRIELLDASQQGAGAAMTQYGYRLGMLSSGAGALLIAEFFSWEAAYLLMSVGMGIGMLAVLWGAEPFEKAAAKIVEPLSNKAPVALRFAFILGLSAAAIALFFVVRDTLLPSFGLPKWAPNIIATLLSAGAPVIAVALLPPPSKANIDSRYAALYDWLGDAVKKPFIDIATRKGWMLILLFIVLYKLGDATLGSMAMSFYLRIGFTKLQVAGVTKVFGLIASLAGIAVGGSLVLKLGMRQSLVISGILQMLSNLMFAWQAHKGADLQWLYATIGIENFTGGLASAAFVAYLSGLCNIAFTATHYALFSSLAAVGRTVLVSPMGGIAEQIGWVRFFILSTLLAIPGMMLLVLMIRRFPSALEGRHSIVIDDD